MAIQLLANSISADRQWYPVGLSSTSQPQMISRQSVTCAVVEDQYNDSIEESRKLRAIESTKDRNRDDMQHIAIAAMSKHVEPSETSQNLVSIDNSMPDEEIDSEDDYSASICAIIQRQNSLRWQNRRKRCPPSFSIDIDNAARRSSAYTTSSGDTIISMEESGNQEQIFENLKLHKEVLSVMKQQSWPLRRKIKHVRQAKAYIRQHEGALQERLAQSHSTKDVIARVSLFITKKWQYFRRELINLRTWLIPWEIRIMEIESHFGSAVASYFTFLRWLFWINLVIATTLTAFVAIPEVLTANVTLAGERKIMLKEESNKSMHLLTLWEFEGILKYSPFFYGWYTNQDSSNYRLPLAYFITNVVVYTYSFVAILRKMAKNSRLSKLTEKEDEYIFSWKLFTGWDFMIGNPETSHNRIASIVLGFKEALLEEAEKQKDERNWKIISMRIFVNVAVLSLLALSAYAVIKVVERSTEHETHNWWRQNEITIVMSLITYLFPIFFEILGFLENYHPRKQLRIQLARIMVLNLLNLYSLIFALFHKINSMKHDLRDLKPTYTNCVRKLVTCDDEVTHTEQITTLASLSLALISNLTHFHVKREISKPTLPFNEQKVFFLNPILDNHMYEDFNDTIENYDDYDNDRYEISDTSSSNEFYTISHYDEHEDIRNMSDSAIRYNISSVTVKFLINSTTAKDLYSLSDNETILATTVESIITKDSEDSFSPSFLDKEEFVGKYNIVSTIVDVIPTTIAKYTPEISVSTLESEEHIIPVLKNKYIMKCFEKICTTSSKNLSTFLKQMDPKIRKKLRRSCWETMFGQELAKLTVMDLILTILATLSMDFFRAVFVRFMNNCWCWDLEKQFPQYGDFKIAENILHLVNNQGMVWMGMFFSPGLTALNLIKLGILMYLRSWAVLTCNVPHEVVFRASRSNNFYFALLLTMLFLCVLPVGYAIVWVEPSWHCGPFTDHPKIYNIVTQNVINSLPKLIQRCFDYVASPGIVIPLIVLMTLIIYYMASLAGSLREANNDLKMQLRHERTEERRKLFKIVEKRQNVAETPLSKWKKILPSLPQGGISRHLEVIQSDNLSIAVMNLNNADRTQLIINTKEDHQSQHDHDETLNEKNDLILNNTSFSKRNSQSSGQSEVIPKIEINEEKKMRGSMKTSDVSEN